MKYGNRIHRLEDLPYGKKELVLHNAWHEYTETDWASIALNEKFGELHSESLDEHTKHSIATIIQWLGTPCGENFLNQCDFFHKEEVEKSKGRLEKRLKGMSVFEFMKWRKEN
jgi:hypothetical protein